jgi:hypothetical protein
VLVILSFGELKEPDKWGVLPKTNFATFTKNYKGFPVQLQKNPNLL